MNHNVTVIIRSVGERTEGFCKAIVSKQVPPKNIYTINEKPFYKAVIKTFKIGIEMKNDWTLAIDADVLVTNDAISQMIDSASKLGDKLFIYQGYVLDKIFNIYRQGGPHLYKTKWLNEALKLIPQREQVIRAESDTYKLMAQKGKIFYIDKKVFGLHDFEQFYADYFRKGFFHAYKHPGLMFNALKQWYNLLDTDEDYKIIFEGYSKGILHNSEIRNDIDFFKKNSTFKKNEKKDLLPDQFKNEYVSNILENFNLKRNSRSAKKLRRKSLPHSISYKIKLPIINILKSLGKILSSISSRLISIND